MRIYKNQILVGGKNLTLVTINQDEGEEKIEVVKNPPIHHIQIIDRSGSMAGHIHALVAQLQQTVELMSDEDYLSVIWFSSAGQYRTLVKGAKKSPELIKVLDDLRSVYGTTCFSDPIKEAKSIIEELSQLCPTIAITLFTDGQAVTPWSNAEEEEKVKDLVKSMQKQVIAVNCIGYGNFYNSEFLREISSLTEYGIFTHSSEIEEYYSIFAGNIERIVESKVERVHIEFGIDVDGIYLNRKFTKMDKLELFLSRLDRNKNQFFLVSEKPEFNFFYNDKEYHSKDITETVAEPTVNNFLHAYANGLYYKGDAGKSLDVLQVLKDKALIDSHFAAFTPDERAKHQKALLTATLFTSGRNLSGRIEEDYLPAKDAFCVMDVIDILVNTYSFYMPFHEETDDYKRIGRKTVDEFNLFTRTTEPVLSGFESIVWNKARVNLGINVLIPGTVSINPKEAEKVGLPKTIASRIFRTYNLIRDGYLNQKRIIVVMPEKVYQEIQDQHDICEIVFVDPEILREKEKHYGVKYVGVKLHLHRIPVINRTFAGITSGQEVYTLCKKQVHLEAKQRWLNSFYKSFEEQATATQFKEGLFESMTAEQLEVCQAHGLRKDGTYSPIAPKTATKEECSDSYETRSFEFVFKGISSLPTIKEAREKIAAKKTTISVEVMEKALREIEEKVRRESVELDKAVVKTRDWLTQELLNVKSELFKLRTQLACAKMALLLTGSSFTGFTLDKKGNLVYEEKDMTLYLKTNRVVEYF